jgi:hypothetical protein
MAKKGDIYLGATVGTVQLMTAFGRKLTIADNEISKSERTASGRLVKDIIATPRKITLTYEAIDGDELAKFIALYETYDELILQIQHTDDPPSTTPEPGSYYDEYTVLMEPTSRERILLRGDGLYGNVSIEFNEVDRP